MIIRQFSPVLIPTLNRYTHFKKCIISLSKCKHADKTDLIISLDFPLKDIHWEGYNKIKEFLPKIRGFKSVYIIERKINFGPINNYFESRKEVLNSYDKIIFSEDDNTFSPNLGLVILVISCVTALGV